MIKVSLIEYISSLLETRADILRWKHYEVAPFRGHEALLEELHRQPGLMSDTMALVVGHRAPLDDRRQFIERTSTQFSAIPIIALLSRDDARFPNASFNCPADQPELWLITLSKAVGRIS